MMANKPANITAKIVDQLLSKAPLSLSPFGIIRKLTQAGKLLSTLKELKTGQYGRIYMGLQQLVKTNINFRTCSIEDLEKIYGIGKRHQDFLYFIQEKIKS